MHAGDRVAARMRAARTEADKLRRMIFCQACGARNTADARFYNMCGARIAATGEPGGPVMRGGGEPSSSL